MDILSLEQIDRLPRETVLTVGIFDGVHLGHRRIVEMVCEAAKRRGWLAAAMTFDPHPAEVVAPGSRPVLLTTADQRIELLDSLGLDVLVIADDLRPLFALEPEAFVAEVLAGTLRAGHVVEGPDWTFGRGRRGDVRLLRELGGRHGFDVTEVPWFVVNDRRVSSTAIRAMLRDGDVSAAAGFLGRRYFADGTVVAGAGRGQALGVPTANIATVNELLPATGVYAGSARVGRHTYAAAIFLGRAATFGETAPTFEAHLIGFAGGELPGTAIRVAFAERLRDVRPFDSPVALADQIHRDIERARAAFEQAAPHPL